jgi:hypothetical protein
MNTTVHEISTLVLGLPVRSRALLADLLLDSLDEGTADANENAWLELARQRDKEITAGRVECKSHTQIMIAARKALQCSG